MIMKAKDQTTEGRFTVVAEFPQPDGTWLVVLKAGDNHHSARAYRFRGQRFANLSGWDYIPTVAPITPIRNQETSRQRVRFVVDNLEQCIFDHEGTVEGWQDLAGYVELVGELQGADITPPFYSNTPVAVQFHDARRYILPQYLKLEEED
jgi:hypothetical protein